MRFTKLILGAVAASAMYAGSANAVAVLKFDDPNSPGGFISYNGAGGPATGTDILFQTLQGLGTPANAGAGNQLYCFPDCIATFTTGNFIGMDAGTYVFGNGGSFTIRGSLFDQAGGAGNLIASGILLSGSFSGDRPTVAAAGGLTTFQGFGADEKNDDIEAYFGFGPNQAWNYASTEIAVTCPGFGGGNAFNCEVVNSDLNNIETPEPGTLALLGIGLLGLGLTRRRTA